jgi:acyl-CoA synthetase (NDP forming)
MAVCSPPQSGSGWRPRGAPPSDIDAIADCLERLSQLALDFPELHEIDMNPLIVFEQGKGAAVVDARIFIS